MASSSIREPQVSRVVQIGDGVVVEVVMEVMVVWWGGRDKFGTLANMTFNSKLHRVCILMCLTSLINHKHGPFQSDLGKDQCWPRGREKRN